SAPVVVQRATGRERIETYGNSSPIIHSVFHNSVEKLGAQNAVSVLFATYLPEIKVLRPIFLWILAKNPINGADPKRGRENQVAKLRSGRKARGGANRILVFCPCCEIRLYCGIMPMFAANPLVTNVTKVVRTDTEQISFEVFDGQQISQTTFVLDLGSKVLTIAAPKSLLCAVASERRREKWKLTSESVGCGSAWKWLTSKTRTVCSN